MMEQKVSSSTFLHYFSDIMLHEAAVAIVGRWFFYYGSSMCQVWEHLGICLNVRTGGWLGESAVIWQWLMVRKPDAAQRMSKQAYVHKPILVRTAAGAI